MKIAKFSMLIVDDNRQVSESIAADIGTWLEEKGFELNAFFQIELKGVLEEIKKNEVELLVIDYALGGKESGDTIIDGIRSNDYYHDVIFYTGGNLEKILTKRYNGVFYCSKKDAPDIIKEIISLRLKRSSDLATLRGWIVADAIKLEGMIDDILMKRFEPRQDIFEDKILRRKGILDFFNKQAMLNSFLSDEVTKLNVANDQTDRAKKLRECKEILKTFENDVVHLRNAVAHSKLDVSPEGVQRLKTLIKDIKFYDFDEKNLIESRRKFRKHRDCLLTLLESW
jgi:hypothetical protein